MREKYNKNSYEDYPYYKGSHMKYRETDKEKGKREKMQERRFFSGGRW